MTSWVKNLLITIGAGVVLMLLGGGTTFVIDTSSRLARIEQHLESIDQAVKLYLERNH